MRIFVRIEAFETSISPDDIVRAQQTFGEQTGEWEASGKLETSGIFADARGGFFVFNVDSAEELAGLLNEVSDLGRIETHPIISLEALREFFAQA